ncbi:MAG: acetolactate decarboxylase [Methanomicrobiaceae archaeon]|nr:acetolactate decarboxylase [Methanomicrobiaceae archaeon]
MKKEHILGFGAAIAIVFFISAAVVSLSPAEVQAEDTVYQSAPFEWLMEGGYNGTISYEEVLKYGDTGLGTFDRLNGEMVLVDGTAYRIDNEGAVSTVKGEMITPFAEVTFFEPDIVIKIEQPINYSDIQDFIVEKLPSATTINTIRLDGRFSEILTRSIPAQECPYRPLNDVIPAEQTTFPGTDIEGTAVGFWHPAYMNGVNAKGFHLHFISGDRDYGGHLLDFTIESGILSIDTEDSFAMIIPWNEDD